MKRLKQAFTLIEVLIVVTIIAILVAITIPGFQKARADRTGGGDTENVITFDE